MGMTVRPVRSSEDMDRFVDLPWKVYADSPLWVPNLKKDDRDLLTPGRHPFWETAHRELFLAERDGETVGRICAVVDEKANAFSGERAGAFGFFECMPDPEAAEMLLGAAYDWLRQEGMTFMRGPLSPSTNYTCGLLVDGFDQAPALMMPWNPERYAGYFEAFRLRKEQDLFAYTIEKDSVVVAPWLSEELNRLKRSNAFTCRTSSKKTLADDVRIMLDIYQTSWAKNFAFSPLSQNESDALVKDLVTYLDPEYFVLFFHDDQPAGGMVAFPDFTPLLRRLNGSLGILAPWHFLRTRKAARSGYRIILFGILEQYRLLGLPLLVFDYMLERARRHPDFNWVEGSWVLEDNVAVDDLIEDFSGRITKRYRIYRKDIM